MPSRSQLLRRRLKDVWRSARKAARAGDLQSPQVHQLRVATRRAVAALEAFRPWLPTDNADWLVRQLSRMRRTAGKARNWDILQAHLSEPGTPVDPTATPLLLARIARLQLKSRKPIRRDVQRLHRKRFPQRSQDFPPKALESLDDDTCQADYARETLQPWIDDILQAARSDTSDLEHLHGVRIRGKVLRYAIELHEDLLGPSEVQEAYRILTDIHARLGILNDHVTMARLLAKLLQKPKFKPMRALLQRLLQREQLQIHSIHHDFARWWSDRRVTQLTRIMDQLLKSCDSSNAKPSRKSS